MGQNLQPMGHLAREFDNAGVVVAVEAGPLHVDVAKSAGVEGPGGVIGLDRSPSRLVGRRVFVIKVPTVSSFRPYIRDGERRIVEDFLLDIKQITVDIRRAKRLLPVGVKERLISAGSVIALPRAGRHREGSERHLRRWLEDLRGGRFLRRGGIDFVANKAAGHAPVKSSVQNVRYLTRAGVVVKAVSRTDYERGFHLPRQTEPWSKVVLGCRGIMLRQTGRDPGYGDGIGERLVDTAATVVCGEDRNGQFVAQYVGDRQLLSNLQLVIEVARVVRDDHIRFRSERPSLGVAEALMDHRRQAQ